MISILIAASVGLVVSILLTPYLIRFFSKQGFGQEIREEGPEGHKSKRGTPTMGGVAILIANAIVDTDTQLQKVEAQLQEQKRLLQIELLKLQKWSQSNGRRHVIVFEGRDAAG